MYLKTPCVRILAVIISVIQMSCQRTVTQYAPNVGSADNVPANKVGTHYDGDERGNGADIVRADDEAAWFSDTRKEIKYCYAVAPGFGASTSTVELAIRSAFANWSNYIETRLSYGIRHVPGFGLTTKSRLLASCDGTEDLQFSFGVVDAAISEALAGRTPVAAAVRTAYNPKTRWGKGFIWFASQGSLSYSSDSGGLVAPFPNWVSSNSLETVLLHELGHMYGNPHVQGTIMRRDIAMVIAGNLSDNARLALTEIDQQEQLIEPAGGVDMAGSLGLKGHPAHPFSDQKTEYDTVKDNFFLLTGRTPVSQTFAKITIGVSETVLTVADALNSYQFVINFKPGTNGAVETDEVPVFSIAYWNSAGYVVAIGPSRGSSSFVGDLKTLAGEHYDVLIDHNTSSTVDIPQRYDGDECFAIVFDSTYSIRLLDKNTGDVKLLFITPHNSPWY